MLREAINRQGKLRMALVGPSGSGKTYTALTLAKVLSQGGKVAVIDTENGSVEKYASEYLKMEPVENQQRFLWDNLDDFSPKSYVAKIKMCEAEGVDVIVIDSATHEWKGPGGALDMVEEVANQSKSANSFAAWRKVTPEHNRFVDAIIRSKAHVIVTIRAKTEYVLQEDERGRKVPTKIGLQPEQRDNIEYEFDVIAHLDSENKFTVTKTRCSVLQGYASKPANREVADILVSWLTSGEAPIAPEMSDIAKSFLQKIEETPEDKGQDIVDELRDVVRSMSRFEADALREAYIKRFSSGKAAPHAS